MPVLDEVKEEPRPDEQEIADLARKIKEANRAKLAQSAAFAASNNAPASFLQHPLAMARPGQPAIQQYFNGAATPATNGQSNGGAAAPAAVVNGKPTTDEPVDEESKE